MVNVALRFWFNGRKRTSGPDREVRAAEAYVQTYLFFSAARAAARRAIGTRNGEQDTYDRPARWKKSIESGSPPCSPQTPVLRPGLVMRPFSSPWASRRAA